MTLVGMVLIPFFLKRTEAFDCEHEESRPNIRFKDKWFDAIFGNSEDGLEGDKYYKAKTTPSWWTTYNWCANRNPIHNLALKMGVNEVITHYTWIGNRYTEDTIGREGYVYSEAIGASGKVYPMFLKFPPIIPYSMLVEGVGDQPTTSLGLNYMMTKATG